MTNLAQNNGTNNTFVNLSNAVTEQHENRLNEFTEILNAETEASANGQLFCDKDTFLQMCEDLEIFEY